MIMPAYSCPSLPAAAIRAGLKPVLCDTEQESFRMNVGALSSRIGPDTAAIVAVHLLGIPERIFEIREMARKLNIVLIEDAAQAFGNTIELKTRRTVHSNEHRHLGTFGISGYSASGGESPGSLGGGVIWRTTRERKRPCGRNTIRYRRFLHILFFLLEQSCFSTRSF